MHVKLSLDVKNIRNYKEHIDNEANIYYHIK